MSTPRPAGSLGDELSNLGIGLLIACAILAGLLRGAGSLAARRTGAQCGRVLDHGRSSDAHGRRPGLVGLAGVREHGRQIKTDPYRIVGTATRAEVAEAASEKALLRRAGILRPSLSKPGPADVGYRIGNAHGKGVWASVEDSILLVGPPRSGKGAGVVVNMILDAPGAVMTTSTRPDNLTSTLRARQRRGGPVAVFDPQCLAGGVPAGLRWSPVRGCEDPLTAMIRGTGLASGTGLSAGGVEGGGFREGKTRTALQALLHAAALDRRQPGELFRWILDPASAAEAVAILTANPRAAVGWADLLQAMIDSDPRTRDSIWQGVSLSLAALADPRVLDAVSPREGEDFDPAAFLRDRGTLYLLATGAGANNSAALVAAFIEDLVETARRLAARSPGARLDPPVLLALDEIGNLSSLPSLPTLMAEGGGSGLTTLPVLQSLAQARDKWGRDAAAAVWGRPSSRSSSAAAPTATTSKTSPPLSASATSSPTPPPSATTAPARRSGRSGECRSCRPTPSAPSRKAPPSSCCAPPAPS